MAIALAAISTEDAPAWLSFCGYTKNYNDLASSPNRRYMRQVYGEDLAYIHDVGFGVLPPVLRREFLVCSATSA